ncbi:MAG: type II toxin-antitoxin system HicB family antitoxin [Betaproteobacteria bacterium]|nr:type II toxin-antitoxin system HicB family antitoxin [Betaproteobacteria bacterium]
MQFYPVTLTPNGDGTLCATFVDVPEAVASGADEEDALLRAADALVTELSSYIVAGLPVPHPGKPAKGQKTVCLSALQCAKLEVYQTMISQGMKKSELARRLGWYMPQIVRLFNLRHASRFDYVEAAARALGKSILFKLL